MVAPKLLDVVATLQPASAEQLTLLEPEHAALEHLPIGQVGTIVEVYEHAEPPQYLVEFADLQGREYALATLRADQLLVLHYELAVA